MTPEEMLAFLGHVARTVSDYLDRIVVVGGFAPVLYRYHPAMMATAADPPSTNDLDLAVPENLEIIAGVTLAARFKSARFTEVVAGPDPPASQFIPPLDWGPGLSVEVLTPLHGPPEDRKGRSRSVVTLQRGGGGGIQAIRLRWIDLLLAEPWTVSHDEVQAIPEGLALHVAHPAAYLAQKLLSSAEPTRRSKAKKDHANCYIVVAMTHDRPALAREIVRRLASTRTHRRWLESLVELAGRLFSSATSVGSLNVATVLSIPEARVAQVMRPFADTLAGAMRDLPRPKSRG